MVGIFCCFCCSETNWKLSATKGVWQRIILWAKVQLIKHEFDTTIGLVRTNHRKWILSLVDRKVSCEWRRDCSEREERWRERWRGNSRLKMQTNTIIECRRRRCRIVEKCYCWISNETKSNKWLCYLLVCSNNHRPHTWLDSVLDAAQIERENFSCKLSQHTQTQNAFELWKLEFLGEFCTNKKHRRRIRFNWSCFACEQHASLSHESNWIRQMPSANRVRYVFVHVNCFVDCHLWTFR